MQKFIAITILEFGWKKLKVSEHLNHDGKIVSEMDPWHAVNQTGVISTLHFRIAPYSQLLLITYQDPVHMKHNWTEKHFLEWNRFILGIILIE